MSPGIASSGLFWTVRIPDSWVMANGDDLEDGARMRVDELHLLDYGTLANSLGFITPQTRPSRSVASFDLRWMGETGPTSATDSGTNRFTYSGIFTHATLSWSATVPSQHFKFHSASANSSKETFAELVNERNGSFFASDEDDA